MVRKMLLDSKEQLINQCGPVSGEHLSVSLLPAPPTVQSTVQSTPLSCRELRVFGIQKFLFNGRNKFKTCIVQHGAFVNNVLCI